MNSEVFESVTGMGVIFAVGVVANAIDESGKITHESLSASLVQYLEGLSESSRGNIQEALIGGMEAAIKKADPETAAKMQVQLDAAMGKGVASA